MYELRNSLTHQYVATVEKQAGIKNLYIKNNLGDNRAIIRGRKRFTLNVAKLISDLGIAWGGLRQQLKLDPKKREDVADMLNKLPILQ
jgi:hypothetical protein